jgi:hypothetical protein
MLVGPYAAADWLFTNQARVRVVRLAGARRHGIMPLPAPRMATPQPTDSEPASTQDAVGLHRLEKVAGTGRLKPQPFSGPAKKESTGEIVHW